MLHWRSDDVAGPRSSARLLFELLATSVYSYFGIKPRLRIQRRLGGTLPECIPCDHGPKWRILGRIWICLDSSFGSKGQQKTGQIRNIWPEGYILRFTIIHFFMAHHFLEGWNMNYSVIRWSSSVVYEPRQVPIPLQQLNLLEIGIQCD